VGLSFQETDVRLSRQEERVLEHLDVDGMLTFLRELVSIPSVGGEETEAQRMVGGWMEENGLRVDLWEIDLGALRQHPAYSAEIERDEALGVVGRMGIPGRRLVLNGHVDVVPPGDLSAWSFSPWDGTVVEGSVRGRGALDMKGGLACALFVAKAIRDAAVRLEGELVLQSVVGEEDGGLGTLATILRGHRGDGCIILEPTDLAICTAQAGALSFRLTVRGKAAHGCVRDQGISALDKFLPIYRELLALEEERNPALKRPLFEAYRTPFPLSVGTIRGGDWPSSVPDRLCVEGRYGLIPGESAEGAREAFRAAVDRAVRADPWLREHPPELEWWGGRFLPAETSRTEAVVRVLESVATEILGSRPRIEGVTFGSDLRHFVLEGETPTVLFGPGNIRSAHGADESVPVVELEKAMRVLAVATLRFCGYQNG
jgi:acetylornithine deacetylase